MIKVFSRMSGTSLHDAFDWQIEDGGYLTIIMKNGDQVATYAPGRWEVVIDEDPVVDDK